MVGRHRRGDTSASFRLLPPPVQHRVIHAGAETAREAAAAPSLRDALGTWMQPSTASGGAFDRIRDETAARDDEASQFGGRNGLPAADAGANRRAHRYQAPATAVSGRMSIRQPVSRAANRAFCPSRPMARLSW